MPKDDWASTRRRDAVRRAKGNHAFSSRKAKPKSKAKKQGKIRQQMQASQRFHDKKLGRSTSKSEGPKRVSLAAGSNVQIRRDEQSTDWQIWQPYTMQKTLTLAPVAIVDGYAVFQFEGWLIRIPRPSGF